VIALIAHVRNVDAFVLGRDLGERNQFIGLGMGGQPFGPVIVDAAGRIYGTTWVGGNGTCSISNGPGCGVVFEIAAGTNPSGIVAFGAG
jgi:hypothetical protein